LIVVELLVTPPGDVEANPRGRTVNVGGGWCGARQKDVPAPADHDASQPCRLVAFWSGRTLEDARMPELKPATELALGGFESALFESAEKFIEARPSRTWLCLIVDVHLSGMSGTISNRGCAAKAVTCPSSSRPVTEPARFVTTPSRAAASHHLETFQRRSAPVATRIA
jgi:hypothetical protein